VCGCKDGGVTTVANFEKTGGWEEKNGKRNLKKEENQE
jgi:hypothetical protein